MNYNPILDSRISETQQSFENQHRELEQRITEVQQSLENQISELNYTQTVSLLRQLITSLKSRIAEVEKLLSKTQSATTEFINITNQKIANLTSKSNIPTNLLRNNLRR